MAIKFYADKRVARAVAVQLNQRGIDVIRCVEVGMALAGDFEHLEDASEQSRQVLTNDRASADIIGNALDRVSSTPEYA